MVLAAAVRKVLKKFPQHPTEFGEMPCACAKCAVRDMLYEGLAMHGGRDAVLEAAVKRALSALGLVPMGRWSRTVDAALRDALRGGRE